MEHSAPLYVAAKTKHEKTQVIASVVEKVRKDSHGGGFVKRDFHTGLWFEIGTDKARDKVGHAIRRTIEEGKKKKGHSKEAKEKKQKEAEEGNLSSANLEDFWFNETKQLSMAKTKSLEGHGEGALFNSVFPSEDKANGVVMPSFLYQQPSFAAPALDNTYATNSQPSRSAFGQGFGLQNNMNNLMAQNSQRPLVDMLGQQMSVLGNQRFNQSHQSNPNIANSSLDQNMMNNFLSMSSRQLLGETVGVSSPSLQLDQFNQFGNLGNSSAQSVNGQSVLLEQNYIQLAGGPIIPAFSGSNARALDRGNTMNVWPSMPMRGNVGQSGGIPNMVQNPESLNSRDHQDIV